MSRSRSSDSVPYCGDPPLALGLGWARTDGGVLGLFAGRRAAFSFNTRTAIRAGADILGLKTGDEVLAPAYNCGSELDPLRAAGLDIRLYPVDSSSMVDPAEVERQIGPRTRAIYLTHYFGVLQPGRFELRRVADAHGLWLIEDCALSLLSGAQPVEGYAGHIALFCFYKFFPVVAGGSLVVNDAALALPSFTRSPPFIQVARRLARAGIGHLLGQARAATALRTFRGRWVSHASETEAPDSDPDMPRDYYFDSSLTGRRLSHVTARALAQYDLNAVAVARRSNHAHLLAALSDVPGLTPLFPTLPSDAVPLALALQAKDRAARNALVAALQVEGIVAAPWWGGYNSRLDFADRPGANLAAARDLKDRVLALPVFQTLGPAAIDHIALRTQALIHH